MKKKVAEIIKDILEENKIEHCFTLIGGGSMHMNDSFGHADKMKCVYCLHEQGAAIAAEAYARVNNRMPVVCVTSGPGGTNTMTGVLCAWQDNIPMLVISGQVKTTALIKNTGLKLRQFGEQEYTIVDSVKPMTKYAKLVEDPYKIRYYLEKAIYLANSGRRGPCWIDVPLDIQGAFIDDDNLEKFIPEEKEYEFDGEAILKALVESKHPVVLAGNDIRTSNAYEEFCEFCRKFSIPILAAKSIADILPVDNPKYYGNFGISGGRAGNFIVQNADLLLVLGCRLSFGEIGYEYELFSPHSIKIVVEADAEELKKNTVKIDIPVNVGLDYFFKWINTQQLNMSIDENWITYCNELKARFPIFQSKFAEHKNVNAYCFAKVLQEYMSPTGICVVGNSCSSVSIKQCGISQPKQRMWGNVNCGTLGYDIPAALGAALASGQEVICCTGDGSFQLNFQELQTILNYNQSVKFFVFNNGGYRSIILSQSKAFGRLSGCNAESGLILPCLSKIAEAYEIPYISCKTNDMLDDVVQTVLSHRGCIICEITEDKEHSIEPKLSNRILEDGRIISSPLSDLFPFLEREEYNMYSDFKVYINKSNGGSL